MSEAATQVEFAVRRWLDARAINPATGEAPDAMLSVTALPITAFGATVEPGEPDLSWSVTATLYLPPDDSEHLGTKVARVTERFERDLAEDPDLGDGLTASWRGTAGGPHGRVDAPAGYGVAIDVLLTVFGTPQP